MVKKDKFDISELLSFEKSTVRNWLDRLKFFHILLVWFGMVSLYGLMYYYLSSQSNYLFDTLQSVPVHALWESMYFSFITATTTGFGDIVPVGSFKIISIAEVITGLLLLAIVTSKFVSIKQDQIMKEIYDISINEKISRLRSSLFLYKQHLNRLSGNILDGRFKHIDLKNLGMYFKRYESVLIETLTLVTKEDSKHHDIVDLDLDLLAKSVIGAAAKTIEAGDFFSENKIKWIRENTDILALISDLNRSLFVKFKESDNIPIQTKRTCSSLKKVSIYLNKIIEE